MPVSTRIWGRLPAKRGRWAPDPTPGLMRRGDSFGTSILDFCLAYADQNERDYESPVKAVKSRRLLARTGLQGVSVAVAQAPNPRLDDLLCERQRARLELIGDRLGCCQHVRKGSLGRTRRDTGRVCEGEQRLAGEAIMPAEH